LIIDHAIHDSINLVRDIVQRLVLVGVCAGDEGDVDLQGIRLRLVVRTQV
jgi:hypothetical protein